LPGLGVEPAGGEAGAVRLLAVWVVVAEAYAPPPCLLGDGNPLEAWTLTVSGFV